MAQHARLHQHQRHHLVGRHHGADLQRRGHAVAGAPVQVPVECGQGGLRGDAAPDRAAGARCLPGRDQPDRAGRGAQAGGGVQPVSLQATEAGYEVGTKTAIDVLSSRELLVQAQTNYSQAKYGYLNDIIALRLAAGNLDPTTIKQINGWLVEPPPPAPEGDRRHAGADPATAPAAARSPPQSGARRTAGHAPSVRPESGGRAAPRQALADQREHALERTAILGDAWRAPPRPGACARARRPSSAARPRAELGGIADHLQPRAVRSASARCPARCADADR